MDVIDRKLVQILQKNAKITIKELSNRLNLSSTPVYDRIKKLEKDGTIKGYTIQIDKEKFGLLLTAFCTVTMESHHKDQITTFEKDILKLKEVAECYHIAGSFDYLLKIHVKDMKDYQSFITKELAALTNINKLQSSFVMTEVKNHVSIS